MPNTTDRNTSNTYVLTARIVDNVVVLSGDGLVDNTLSVPRGSDPIVNITDAPDHFLYASTVPASGARASSWDRGRGQVQTRFSNVDTELDNIVYAASTATGTKPKYGPFLKIKPQG